MKRVVVALVLGLFALNASAEKGTTGGDHHILLIAGVGMTFVNPYGPGPSVNATVGARVAQGLYLGADFGVHFLGDQSASGISVNSTGATSLPFLPTLIYRMPFNNSTMVRQYFGLSIGPNIWIQSIPAGTAASTSETKIYFEMLLKPGVEVIASHQVGFLIEPRFGVIKNQFIWAPQAAVTVGF